MKNKLRLPKLDDDARMLLLFLSFNGSFYFVNAFFTPFLGAHYASLGIDPFRIGILSSLGSISSIFILPLWSRLSDGTGNRKGVLMLLILGSAATSLLFLTGKSFWILLPIVLAFVAFFNSIVPLSDAIIVSYISKTRFKFSIVRAGGTIGFIICIIFSGLLFNYNRNISFVIGGVLYSLLVLLVMRFPQVGMKKKEKRKIELKKLFKNKKIIFILFMACMIQIVMSCYYCFLGVYIRELGYSSEAIGMSSLVAAASEIPVLLIIDKILVNFSVPSIALFSAVIMSIRMFIMFGAKSLGLILVAQAGNGLAYMTLYYSCVTFLNNEMEDDMKSSGQSVLAFFQAGVGTIVGSVLGGYISGKIGIRYTFLSYGIFLSSVSVICICVFAVLAIRKRKRS